MRSGHNSVPSPVNPASHPSTPTRRWWYRSVSGLIPIVAVVSLAACGSSDDSSDDSVASLGTEAADSQTATTVASSDQDAILAYTACLREQGLDVDDPTFDADGNMQGGFFGEDSGLDPQSEEFQAAQTACQSLIEGVDFGGFGNGDFDVDAMQDATLAYTQCLRDEGLEVDDLDFDAQGPGGGGSIPEGGSIPQGGGPAAAEDGDTSSRLAEILGLDPDDPATAAALEVCEPLLEGVGPDATTTVP